MTDTPIDRAHATMEADPENDQMRLAFFGRLAESELFVLLEQEASGDKIDPRIVEADGARYVLAFDLEERLAAFAQGDAPYAAMTGRALATMLTGHAIGIGLNIGNAPSELLIPADAVDWLHETLRSRPVETSRKPASFGPPSGLPEALLQAIDAKLALMSGLATSAHLVGVSWDDADNGHMLVLIDPVPGSEDMLARAIHEALVFSGLADRRIDVAFLKASDPAAEHLARVGLRFDLPQPPHAAPPVPPGMDPDKPPKLR